MTEQTRVPFEELSSSDNSDASSESSEDTPDQEEPEGSEEDSSSEDEEQDSSSDDEAEQVPLPDSTNSSLINALRGAQITDNTMAPTNESGSVRSQSVDRSSTGNNPVALNKPAEYRGERSKFQDFKLQVNLYTAYYQDKFASEEQKIMWIMSFLRGEAQDAMVPIVMEINRTKEERSSTARTALKSSTAFLEHMEVTFGERDTKKSAEHDITRLKQVGAATKYVAEFRKLALLSQMPTEALPTLFYQGLKNHVQMELDREELPDSVDKLYNKAIRLDDWWYEHHRRQTTASTAAGQRKRTNTQTYRPRYRANTRRYRNDAPRDNRQTQPMELDEMKRGRSGKQQKDKKDVECYNCHKKGHYKSECRQPIRQVNEIKGKPKSIRMTLGMMTGSPGSTSTADSQNTSQPYGAYTQWEDHIESGHDTPPNSQGQEPRSPTPFPPGTSENESEKDSSSEEEVPLWKTLRKGKMATLGAEDNSETDSPKIETPEKEVLDKKKFEQCVLEDLKQYRRGTGEGWSHQMEEAETLTEWCKAVIFYEAFHQRLGAHGMPSDLPESMEDDVLIEWGKRSGDQERVHAVLAIVMTPEGYHRFVQEWISFEKRKPDNPMQLHLARKITEDTNREAMKQRHDMLSWTACTDDKCQTHKSEKDGAGWYPQPSRARKNKKYRRTKLVYGTSGQRARTITWPENHSENSSSEEEQGKGLREGEAKEIIDTYRASRKEQKYGREARQKILGIPYRASRERGIARRPHIVLPDQGEPSKN